MVDRIANFTLKEKIFVDRIVDEKRKAKAHVKQLFKKYDREVTNYTTQSKKVVLRLIKQSDEDREAIKILNENLDALTIIAWQSPREYY